LEKGKKTYSVRVAFFVEEKRKTDEIELRGAS
jgi:hypothetical protein